MSSTIYFDNNSTTQTDYRVAKIVLDCMTNEYGNSASSHALGHNADSIVKKARQQVANLIECHPKEIVFTSGATEAINLALKGIKTHKKGKHIITASTEHSAVLETCKYLETIGYDVTYLPVNTDGLIDAVLFKDAIQPDTILACLMLVNNETGIIQPISEISEIAHERGVVFMTDATQAGGKFPIKVNELNADLLCLSAHKFYGPKGVGALYIRSNPLNNFKIEEQIHGGRQERIRSGTLNVPGLAGMGAAAEICSLEMLTEINRIEQLRNKLETELSKSGRVKINGSNCKRVCNTSNILFEGIDASLIFDRLNNVMLSNGSACTSALIQPSHVLLEMGLTEEQAFSSIRFSLGRFNTEKEVDYVVSKLKQIIDINAGTVLS